MGLRVDVSVDGARSEALSSRFRGLSLTDGVGHEADGAVLTISVRRAQALRVALPPLGSDIAFAVARDGAQAVPLGDPMKTSGIGGNTRDGALTVEASGIDPRSPLNAERSASYSGQSIGDIAAAIAERAGLVPAVSGQLADVVPVGSIQQAESDKQFLRRLVREHGGRFVVKDGRAVVLATGEKFSAGTGRALPALSVNLTEDGVWVRWRRGDSEVRGSVSVQTFAQDGSTIVTRTAGSGIPRRRLPGLYRDPDDALRAAEARLRQAQSSRDWIEIERELTPEARALYPLEAAGAPEGFTEELIIQEVRHTVGQQVARTVIRARP